MTLIVSSPIAGRTSPLESVPDPVFGQRMMGDGMAVHPLGDTVCAPFDGEVVSLHESGHAVAVRSSEGAELLIHVGLDTVALKGRGFTPLVAVGDSVSRGEPLIRFDLDAVALGATSLVTPVILTNPEDFAIVSRTSARTVGTSDELMAISRVGSEKQGRTDIGRLFAETVTLSLPHGIHARPAARVGECARGFDAEVSLVHESKQASARSTVALLALGTRFGDQVTVQAQGADAEAAVAAIAALLRSNMGEAAVGASSPEVAVAAVGPGGIGGIIASPGLAAGPAARIGERRVSVEREASDPATERQALDGARAAVRQRLETRAAAGDTNVEAVLKAHLALLDDPQIAASAEAAIASGSSAGFAWRSAIQEQVDVLLNSGNAHLAERTADLIDIEQQVLSALSGEPDEDLAIPRGAILICDDLLPSQLIGLAENDLAGVCMARGGPTSHVAILCAGMGIPALVAMGDALSAVDDGTQLLLDAEAGRVMIAPSRDAAQSFAARVAQRRDRRTAAQAAASDECRTADGTRIKFFANVGSVEEARAASGQGAEGSGLVRSEFLFLDRDEPPSEDEQAAAYQAICEALRGLPVLVRLLDVGGDKPAAYIPFGAEENPALGLRGIRVGLAHPHLLETQIRAILGVRPVAQCRIMIPMITSVEEVRAVRAVVDRLRSELGVEEAVEVGVMVETPAAAMTADIIASEADFLSIGTNDLTQYALAMDRGNAAVAAGVDAMHPAVLRMIAETCRLASTKGRWVGVCGGLASDPAALPILVGMGVTEISSVPGFVAEGKAIVRAVNLQDARAHATRALQCSSAAEVRSLARAFEDKIL